MHAAATISSEIAAMPEVRLDLIFRLDRAGTRYVDLKPSRLLLLVFQWCVALVVSKMTIMLDDNFPFKCDRFAAKGRDGFAILILNKDVVNAMPSNRGGLCGDGSEFVIAISGTEEINVASVQA